MDHWVCSTVHAFNQIWAGGDEVLGFLSRLTTEVPPYHAVPSRVVLPFKLLLNTVWDAQSEMSFSIQLPGAKHTLLQALLSHRYRQFRSCLFTHPQAYLEQELAYRMGLLLEGLARLRPCGSCLNLVLSHSGVGDVPTAEPNTSYTSQSQSKISGYFLKVHFSSWKVLYKNTLKIAIAKPISNDHSSFGTHTIT